MKYSWHNEHTKYDNIKGSLGFHEDAWENSFVFVVPTKFGRF